MIWIMMFLLSLGLFGVLTSNHFFGVMLSLQVLFLSTIGFTFEYLSGRVEPVHLSIFILLMLAVSILILSVGYALVARLLFIKKKTDLESLRGLKE